jgi:hypothetical protein
MREPIRSIFVESRAWYDKSGGNSYFSNRIHVNGRIVIETPLRLGYDTAYLWDALRELFNRELISEPLGTYYLRQKVDFYHVQNSVPKREMFKDTWAAEDLTERFEAIA